MGVADPPPSPDAFCSGIPEDSVAMMRRKPLFVMGASMGGMIAFHIALKLQELSTLKSTFRGAVLIAPALEVDLPPSWVQLLLKKLVVPFVGRKPMPTCVSS